MAYNKNNHLKRVRYIINIYNSVKERDKPDTYILRVEFPKHNIHISYRTWMLYKNMQPGQSPKEQTSLFD